MRILPGGKFFGFMFIHEYNKIMTITATKMRNAIL